MRYVLYINIGLLTCDQLVDCPTLLPHFGQNAEPLLIAVPHSPQKVLFATGAGSVNVDDPQ